MRLCWTGVTKVGYSLPGDADTAYHGLRGGVVVNGVRADLETRFESTGPWKTAVGNSFVPILREFFWPWALKCGDTAYNVTAAWDEELSVTGFPGFNAREDTAASVPVTVLGKTETIPAYESSCDYDGAVAGRVSSSVHWFIRLTLRRRLNRGS